MAMTPASGTIRLAVAASIVENGGLSPPPVEPRTRATASSPIGFVPPGWKQIRAVRQDVNKDGRADLVMVLEGVDPACVLPTELTPEPMDTNP